MKAPVLLVAYQCGPGMGSVSQIGWEWFTGMAAQREVCLVTHVRNQTAIEASPDRPAGARVIYIDTEWFAGPLYRLAKRLFPRSEHSVFMLSQLDYFVFDGSALRQLRREIRAGAPWRLVHVVTPVTTSAPTLLTRLGLPLMRGPLNCGLPVPPGFDDIMRTESMGLSRLRVLPRLGEALLGSLRNSRAVLVATAATQDAVPRSAQHRCVRMLENAVDLGRFQPAPPLPAPGADRPLRISFVGRLVPVKALPLLLQAMVQVRAAGHAVTLTVAGDGPMAGTWQQAAADLGLADAVIWLGAVPLAQVADVMRDSHVFCLPSIRESGGAVLLEAMACGRAVIGMDFGGPAEIVDAEVGWKVSAADAASAVQGLARALTEALTNPDDCAARGRRGSERVQREHTWAARMAQAEQLYDRILQSPSEGSAPTRPAVASAGSAP